MKISRVRQCKYQLAIWSTRLALLLVVFSFSAYNAEVNTSPNDTFAIELVFSGGDKAAAKFQLSHQPILTKAVVGSNPIYRLSAAFALIHYQRGRDTEFASLQYLCLSYDCAFPKQTHYLPRSDVDEESFHPTLG